jgi:hypothetical protein
MSSLGMSRVDMSAVGASSLAPDAPQPLGPRERHLVVVPPRPWTTQPVPTAPTARRAPRAPRAPFVLLVLTLLVGGLVTLLLLNTALAQGAFVVHDLESRSAQLADREQALQQEVAVEASPARLAKRAKRLGMVPSENPVFLRTSDGRVLGVPQPAAAPPRPAPQPKPSPTATASPR